MVKRSKAALRNLILNSRDRIDSRGQTIPGNGLWEAGAIVRVGRRVLLDENRFFEWIAAQQRKRSAARPRRDLTTGTKRPIRQQIERRPKVD